MKDPFDEVEDRLRQLAPCQVPKELMTRLGAADPAASKIVRFPLRWIAVAAAAASIALLAWSIGSPTKTPAVVQEPLESPESMRIYAPVSERNLLLEAREIGVISSGNSAPVRLVRCLWLDDATYRADDGTQDLQVTRAREQIIPVALEIY